MPSKAAFAGNNRTLAEFQFIPTTNQLKQERDEDFIFGGV